MPFPLDTMHRSSHLSPVAVHVRLSEAELTALLAPFGVGPLRLARGIASGSINTNYRVESAKGTFFVRLAFGRSEEDLGLETRLLDLLREGGLPVVPPRRAEDGAAFVPFQGGALSVFPWSAGEPVPATEVSERHLWELGRILGRLHRLGAGFAARRENPFGSATAAGWLAELTASSGRGDAEVAAALPAIGEGLAGAAALAGHGETWIHADLFRDNVLWMGDRIGAVLDFEMACTAPPVLDVAVTMLDWTWEEGRFSPRRVRPLVEGWRQALGPPAALPQAGLSGALRFAAARFTLSRLRDFHFSPLSDDALVRKDWRRMRDRLSAALALGPAGIAALVG